MRLFNIFCVSFIIVLRLKSVQLLDFEFHNNKALTNVLKNFSSMTRNGIDVKMYSIGKSTGIHDVKSKFTLELCDFDLIRVSYKLFLLILN